MRKPRVGFMVLFLTLVIAVQAHAQSTSIPRSNQPLTGPSRAIEDLAQGYRDRSPGAVGGVLTGDYVFHSIDEGDVRSFFDGHVRADELTAVRNMLEGVKREGVVVFPPAERVEALVDGVTEQVDPEHADSTQHYRMLTVRHFELRIHRHDGLTLETNLPGQTHAFQVVRGDAAMLADGQSADPTRWYIRRWLNDVSGVRAALSARQGECGGEPDPPLPGDAARNAPAAPHVLAIRALTNPACAALQVSCYLPGSERAKVQVYDVSGRLMNERNIEVAHPGTMTVDAGAGAHLTPGVYWVRLAQAKRAPNTRMVVVAR